MDDMTLSIPRQAGILVRREREHQGRTRAQLARDAHVSERLLASLELGDAPGIQLDKLLAVCNALGIELFMRRPGNTDTSNGLVQTASPSYAEIHEGIDSRVDTSAAPDDCYDAVWQDFVTAQGIEVSDIPYTRGTGQE